MEVVPTNIAGPLVIREFPWRADLHHTARIAVQTMPPARQMRQQRRG
jgi:hypothetical protein